MYGFEEIAQWHAESNSSVSVRLKRWKSSGSIYFVFAQYRIVSPYHCDTGIEVIVRLLFIASYLTHFITG